MNSQDFAGKFTSITTNTWQLHAEDGLVHAVKQHNGQVITVEFSQGTSGKWTIRFPRYSFKSKSAHFCPSESDIRMYNNKSIIVSLVSHLKRASLWSEIENQKFFVVNINNSHSDKTSLRTLHRELIKKAVAKSAKKPTVTQAAAPAVQGAFRRGPLDAMVGIPKNHAKAKVIRPAVQVRRVGR